MLTSDHCVDVEARRMWVRPGCPAAPVLPGPRGVWHRATQLPA